MVNLNVMSWRCGALLKNVTVILLLIFYFSNKYFVLQLITFSNNSMNYLQSIQQCTSLGINHISRNFSWCIGLDTWFGPPGNSNSSIWPASLAHHASKASWQLFSQLFRLAQLLWCRVSASMPPRQLVPA